MSNTAITLTPEEVQIVRNMYSGVPEEEITKFLHIAQSLGMNPVFRQIYLFEEDNGAGKKTYTPVCAIDGYRAAAERTGERAGHDMEYIYSKDGRTFIGVKWILLRAGKGGRVDRYPAVALFNEFAARDRYGNLTRFWRERPEFMTGKCAEALAYRIAYPFLSGTYTSEEMERAMERQGRTPKISREVAALSDEDVRKQFKELVGDRTPDALTIFKTELPEGSSLVDLSLENMRLALSDPEGLKKKLSAAEAARMKAHFAALPETEIQKLFRELVGDRKEAAAQVFKSIIPPNKTLDQIEVAKLRLVVCEPYRGRYAKKLDAAHAALATAQAGRTSEASSTPQPKQETPAPVLQAMPEQAPVATAPKPADPNSDDGIRAAFAEWVKDREAAATIVFQHVLPESKKLSEIDVSKMRLVLSDPYRTRYEKKLTEATAQHTSVPAPVASTGETSAAQAPQASAGDPKSDAAPTDATDGEQPTPAQAAPSVSPVSQRRAADTSPVDPRIAAMTEEEVRTEFNKLVAGRVEAAQTVFAQMLPESGSLAEIPVERLRAVLSSPYRERYQSRLDRTARASQAAA